MGKVKVIWDLTKLLPDLRINEKVVVKPAGKMHALFSSPYVIGALVPTVSAPFEHAPFAF